MAQDPGATYGKFFYNSGVLYGQEPDADTLINWGIQIGWTGELLGESESDWTTGLRLRRGRNYLLRLDGNGVATGFQPVQPGTAIITLDNTDGRYDPYNTSSPLYPNVEPGKPVRIINRVNSEDEIKYLFSGRVINLQFDETPDNRKVIVECAEDGRELEAVNVRFNVLDDNRISDIMDMVLDQANWKTTRRKIDPSDETAIIPFWSADGSASNVIQSLADAQGGISFVDSKGNFTYYNYWRTPVSGVVLTEADVLKQAHYGLPWETKRDLYRVTAYPIVLQENVELWRLNEVKGIATNVTLDVWAEYRYNDRPSQAINLQELVAGVDYTANDLADGTGTDRTANVAITVTPFGDTAKLEIKNNHSNGIFITLLKINGDALERVTPTRVERQNPPGNRLIEIGNQNIQTIDDAEQVAEWLSIILESPSQTPTIMLEGRPDLQFEFDLFDELQLDFPSRNIDTGFVVSSIEHVWLKENGQAVLTTLKLEVPRNLEDNYLTAFALDQNGDGSNHLLLNRVWDLMDADGNPVPLTFCARLYLNSTAFDGGKTENVILITSASQPSYVMKVRRVGAVNEWVLEYTSPIASNNQVYNTDTNDVIFDAWITLVIPNDFTLSDSAIYVNGLAVAKTIAVAGGSPPALVFPASLQIGGSVGGYFDGLIGDITILDHIVTADEALDYHEGSPIDGILFKAPSVRNYDYAGLLNNALSGAKVYDLSRGRLIRVIGDPIMKAKG